ncbi:hypothetical protein GCM10009841_07710 [Microlunatus panaciterrae]|uniref:Integral membrane protein n=1 Tax=Microlunatus panaciterrae TaxID=400768 RepID=A0ABS2RHW0_9ACTN|nr:hypothetical protein [Microlunatus panaciterrae]MBM7798576.1 hypothetical protein [Microlunatus panaciterrae]
MSQPPNQGYPPEFRPPVPYGGYSGQPMGYGRPSDPPTQVLPYHGAPLPPPFAPAAARPTPQPPPRPGGVTVAATMAVTASMQWLVVLSFAWLVAAVGADQLDTSDQVQGAFFHIMNRFHLRMIEGLAWPLYGFPLAATVVGLMVLARRAAHRIAFSVAGLAALVWSAWWLHQDLRWWVPLAGYVGLCLLLVWTPAATRWYDWRPQHG